jgi:nucleoside-diphosphate-sugar epimerase
MKTLITGHRGLIGGWIIDELKKRKLEYVGYDIKEGNDLFDPAEFERLNHRGSIRVFEAAIRAGVKRFVYCSSGNVYCWGDGLQDTDEPPYDVHHHPSTDKMHPYPKSKIDTERYLETQKGNGIQIFILRPNCLAPTPEPYFTIYKRCTITRERLVRYFVNAATNTDLTKPEYEIFDCVEPNEWFPGSIRALEMFDKGGRITIREYIDVVKKKVDNLAYFDGHLPRFEKQLEMFEKYFEKEKIETVLDAGTKFPFTSYFLNLTKKSKVDFGYPKNGKDISETVRFKNLNLCRLPDIDKYDLVVCTECLEHLSCNVCKVRDYLFDHVRKGGFILLSFPLGGMNACDYERDDPDKYDEISDNHIREYTEETVTEFIAPLLDRGELIERHSVFTSAYGGNIAQILIRRIA